MRKVIKETIHANGIDIGIYTQDFENEFISLLKYSLRTLYALIFMVNFTFLKRSRALTSLLEQ